MPSLDDSSSPGAAIQIQIEAVLEDMEHGDADYEAMQQVCNLCSYCTFY